MLILPSPRTRRVGVRARAKFEGLNVMHERDHCPMTARDLRNGTYYM